MVKKTLIALAATGSLLVGIGAATPALAQSAPVILQCSPDTNGGTLVNGVCVLDAATAGQPYEGFLLDSNGVDVFIITAGSLPPGLQMPETYGAAGTIVGGTPTTAGTYTFTVQASPFTAARLTTATQTYTVTVDPAPPLTVTFPVTCCNAGTVGSSYLQNFFSSGGLAPFTWTVAAGQLPPGVTLSHGPGGSLTGTPTKAGTYKFTLKVTDGTGEQATESGSITISR
jgi:hypothetical protein